MRSPFITAAVQVVPMPSRPRPSLAACIISAFAATTALRKAAESGTLGASSASTFTAISEATSPASWPPMPSHTANSGGVTTKLSSLWSRTQPMSVRLPKLLTCAAFLYFLDDAIKCLDSIFRLVLAGRGSCAPSWLPARCIAFAPRLP